MQRQDRIGFLDALRGFALFGILVVNLPFMGFTVYDEPAANAPAGIHAWASLAVSTFFELKFYLLFSFLFGMSFSFLVPAQASRHHVTYWLRRMTGLLAFGLLHGILLFAGDILTSYAVLGSALLLARSRDPRTLVRAGLACLVCATIAYGLVALAIREARLDPTGDALAAAAHAAYLDGFWSGARQRLTDLKLVLPFLAFVNWLPALGMFLFGLAAGRVGLFADLPAFLKAHRGTAVLAGAIGLAGNLWFAASSRGGDASVSAFLAFVLSPFFAPCLSFTYLYTLAWLYNRATAPWTLLESAGRMSLTNYLLQALIGGFVFNGWGLGLLGQWNAATLLLLAAVIYVTQIHLSRWYLRHFRTGPDEWLLRSFSHWRWQPFRIAVMALLCIGAVRGEALPVEKLMGDEHWKAADRATNQTSCHGMNNARLLALRARIEEALGHLKQATVCAERAARLEPNNASHAVRLASTLAKSMEGAGALRILPLARALKQSIEAALQLAPRDPEVLYASYRFHAEVPGMLGGDSRRAAALLASLRAISAPLALIAEAEANPDAGGSKIAEALRLAPTDFDVQGAAAEWFCARRRCAEAEAHAKAARQLRPTAAAPYRVLAESLACQGKIAALQELLAVVDKLRPEDKNPHFLAARALVAVYTELDLARVLLHAFLALPPEGSEQVLPPSHAEARRLLNRLGGQ